MSTMFIWTYDKRKNTHSDLYLLQVIMWVEVSWGGWIRHPCRHGSCLGQNPSAVYSLREGGVGRGRGGGWHIEFWVSAGVAHGNQVLFGAGVLTLTLQRLTTHDQLTFWCDPCGNGNCLCSGQPQRLQIQTIYRYKCDVAGQPYGYCAGIRWPSSQREALDWWYLPRLRQEVCGSCCCTADSDATLASILQELDMPCAIIQSLCWETRKCPISVLDLWDDLKDGWMIQLNLNGTLFSFLIFFYSYLILDPWNPIGCNLISRCCNVDRLAGKTPKRKHILPVGRDNPRVWNVNNSLVLLSSRDRRNHLPSVWTRQLNSRHICCLRFKLILTLERDIHWQIQFMLRFDCSKREPRWLLSANQFCIYHHHTDLTKAE